jgi:putative transposase
MKRVRFTEERIIAVRASMRLGRRRPTWRASTGSWKQRCTWKARYGGLDVSDARRLKMLEDENRKLKKTTMLP